ncbi:MAG: DUF2804 family protein [Bacilli bacterium]
MEKDEYERIISPKRKAVPTPDDLINEGKAAFGTFESEFKKASLLDCQVFSKIFRRLKLTQWEAVEVNLDDIFYVSAISDMGLFGICFNLIFDKKTNKQYNYFSITTSKAKQKNSKVHVAENLLFGTESYIHKGKNTKTVITNVFDKGKAHLEAVDFSKKLGSFKADFSLERVSVPSIVSIPFGENQPLYTEKCMFKAKGSLVFQGKEYFADDKTFAVIDDHHGYYPKHMHYDWLSFFGTDKDKNPIGCNLTQNQSVDPTDYNENLIWMPSESSLLSPVTFTKNHPSRDYQKEKLIWTIKDEFGMVNLTYEIKSVYLNHVGTIFKFIGMDYFFFYGVVSGYLLDKNGKKTEFENYPAIAEDKTIVL